MTAPVPVIEIPDHADTSGIGCPHREEHPGDVADAPDVRPEEMVGGIVVAAVEGADPALIELGSEAVGIEALADLAIAPDDAQTVGRRDRWGATTPFKEVGLPDASHADGRFNDVHADRVGQQCPDDDGTVGERVASQPAERVVVAGFEEGIEIRWQQGRHGSRTTLGVTFVNSVTDQARTLR